MNEHCQSCLSAHWKKMSVCLFTLLDLTLAVRQITYIRHNPSPDDLWMMVIVVARAILTWLVFAIAVTTLNRVVDCHTRKEEGKMKGETRANI